jgi:hypothetical protein
MKPCAQEQRIERSNPSPHADADGNEYCRAFATMFDREWFDCCFPFQMHGSNHFDVVMRNESVKAYPRKHVKYFQVLFKEYKFYHVYENFNHMKFRFNFNPTTRNKISRSYVAFVPKVYSALKFLHKPWDIGEYFTTPSSVLNLVGTKGSSKFLTSSLA